MTCRESLIYRSTAHGLNTLLARRYRITTRFEQGAKKAILDPNRGTLVVMNHPTWGVEATKVFAELALLGVKPLLVIAEGQLQGPVMGNLAKIFQVVAIPDMTKTGAGADALQALGRASQRIDQAFREKRLVVIAGAGRIYRSRLESMGSMAAEAIANNPNAQIVTAYADGLWGSRLSMAGTGEYPKVGKVFAAGVAATIANLGFNPKHPWSLTFTDQTAKLAGLNPAQINASLNTHFNTTEKGENFPRAAVRYRLGWWDRDTPLADPAIAQVAGDIHTVPHDVRKEIVEILIRKTNAAYLREMDPDSNELLTTHLRDGLGMDSLAATELLMEIQKFSEARTGKKIETDSTESILTVRDLILAGNGLGQIQGGNHLPPPSPAWLAEPKTKKRFTFKWNGQSFTRAWLERVISHPNDVAVADAREGAVTNRTLFQKALGLLPTAVAIPDERVGVLLPASAGTDAVVHAIRLAGKVPVVINFTTGADAVRQAIEITGIKQIFTALPVLGKIKWGEEQEKQLGIRFIHLDRVVASLTLNDKARIVAESYLGGARKLLDRPFAKEAGILVTSGSTGMPKSIALTEEMLGHFLEDLFNVLEVNEGDRLLQTGPPFHVLGYIAGIVLPSATGLRMGLLPDPTDYKQMANFVELYRIARMVSPPAFAEGMALASVNGQLDHLKQLIYGAAAMTPSQRRAIQERAPHLQIDEAYGSTETSGALAAATPDSEGWMRILPTVQYKTVDLETGKEVLPGGEGELLVKGPTIITSYVQPVSGAPLSRAGFDDEGYFRTGDLVQLHPSRPGLIKYRTRVGRCYKGKNGEFIVPDLIEDALGIAYPRRDSDAKGYIFSAVGSPHPTEGYFTSVLFTTRDLTVNQANEAAIAHGLTTLISQVYKVHEIPMAGSGKINLKTVQRWGMEVSDSDASKRSADLMAALVSP